MRPIFLLFLSFSLACGQFGEEESVIGPEKDLTERKVREPTQSEEEALNNAIEYPQEGERSWYGHKLSFQRSSPEAMQTSMMTLPDIQATGQHNFVTFLVLTDHETYVVFNACSYIKTLRYVGLIETIFYSERISYTGQDRYMAEEDKIWMGIPHISERVCITYYYDELYEFEQTDRVLMIAEQLTIDRPLHALEKTMMTEMLDVAFYLEKNLPNRNY